METLRLAPAACEGFPGYNDGQMLNAFDYIVDGLESAFAEGYSDEQWQSIADHLGEQVQNGLTEGPASGLL